MAANTSFASPLAGVSGTLFPIPPQIEGIFDTISSFGFWPIAFSVLALLVAYDQGRQDSLPHTAVLIRSNLRADLN